MAEKINLSLFKDFFESSSSADYAKTFINTKNPDENKENIADVKDRISNLKDRIKKMNETENKNKNADETLLNTFLITIKMLQKISACIKSW